jgi:hypothetical protein
MKYFDIFLSAWCGAYFFIAEEASFLQGLALGLSVFFLLLAFFGDD